MNLFEYRNKKDLQGRTTEFRNGSRPVQAAGPSSPKAPQNGNPTRVQSQRTGSNRTRRRLRNATKDRWFYSNTLLNYNQQATGNKTESTNLADDTQSEL